MNDPGKKKRRGETLKKKSICRLPCRASRRAEGGAGPPGRGDARLLWRTPSEVVCAWGAQEAIWSDLSWGLRGMQVVPCMHACMRCVPLPLLDSSALVFIWRSNVPSCPNASKALSPAKLPLHLQCLQAAAPFPCCVVSNRTTSTRMYSAHIYAWLQAVS